MAPRTPPRRLCERQILHGMVLDSSFRELALPLLTETLFSTRLHRAAFQSLQNTGDLTPGYKTQFNLDRMDHAGMDFLRTEAPSREKDLGNLLDYIEILCSSPLTEEDLEPELVIELKRAPEVSEYLRQYTKWEAAPTQEEFYAYSYADYQDFVLDILAEKRRSLRSSVLQRELEKKIGKKLQQSHFSKEVIKPLLEEGLLYKEGDSRKSPLTLEKPIIINVRRWDDCDGLEEGDAETLYPILPFFNEELKTNCHQKNGGLGRGDVFMFNASTGFGKSFFYLNCAKNAADLGLKVLYLDMENKEIRLKNRFARILTGRDAPNSELLGILAPYTNTLFWANLGDEGVLSIERFRKLIKGFDVVVIDYLKLDKFSASATSVKTGGSPGSYIMQLLACVARESNIILITGTQVVSLTKGAGGKVQFIAYRGGPGWVEVAGDCWTAIEKTEHSYGFNLTVMAVKSRDRLLPTGRVFEVIVDTEKNTYVPI